MSDSIDPKKVWAYGKVEKGWYVAKWIWDETYARHLKDMGYQVERSIEKPETRPQ